MAAFSGSRRAPVTSTPDVRFAWMSARHDHRVRGPRPTVVLANEADVDVRAREDPRVVGPREEDVTGHLDPLQHPAVEAAADRLCRQKARALRSPSLDRRSRLLVPVGREIAHRREPAAEDTEHRFDVLATETSPQQLVPRNGGFPTMNSASGHSASLGFAGSDRSNSASRFSMWSSDFRIGSRR